MHLRLHNLINRLTLCSFILLVNALVIIFSIHNSSGATFLTKLTESEDPWKALAKARSLKCSFETVMQADWKNGRLSTTKYTESLVLHFDSIDHDTNHARLIGNQTAADVFATLSGVGITFIEVTGAGNHMVTTIFPTYKQGSQEFVAVSSRHFMGFDYPYPSQRHGTCLVWG